MFKVGDKVTRINNDASYFTDDLHWVRVGEKHVVTKVRGPWIGFNIDGEDTGFMFHSSNFELVKNPIRPHRDLIIAYANGADIQVYNHQTDAWIDCDKPAFHATFMYRIKPTEPIVEIVGVRFDEKSPARDVVFEYHPETRVLQAVRLAPEKNG